MIEKSWEESLMKLTQIRNATNRVEYGGMTFLIDPWLEAQGSVSFVKDFSALGLHIPDPVKEQILMPIYGLPMEKEEILEGVDCYIITHLHPDHIDWAADGTVGGMLKKDIPTFCQNEEDAKVLRDSGFRNVTLLTAKGITVGKVILFKTPCRHGVIEPCGDAMGVIFSAPGEKTLYLAGDTILYEGVRTVLQTYHPEVIMLNSCAAETIENGRLIMNDEDIAAVSALEPGATLYLTHLDNVSHASLTRYTLRARLAKRNVTHFVMPLDGESMTF
jgi:L-ascorbate metabolism protein UlaG (beta-lactamase superfamily)